MTQYQRCMSDLYSEAGGATYERMVLVLNAMLECDPVAVNKVFAHSSKTKSKELGDIAELDAGDLSVLSLLNSVMRSKLYLITANRDDAGNIISFSVGVKVK